MIINGHVQYLYGGFHELHIVINLVIAIVKAVIIIHYVPFTSYYHTVALVHIQKTIEHHHFE